MLGRTVMEEVGATQKLLVRTVGQWAVQEDEEDLVLEDGALTQLRGRVALLWVAKAERPVNSMAKGDVADGVEGNSSGYPSSNFPTAAIPERVAQELTVPPTTEKWQRSTSFVESISRRILNR